MSNYPAGAEDDPRAPYNEVDYYNNCNYCGEPSENSYCNRTCERLDELD